jgi:hypothetical protein
LRREEVYPKVPKTYTEREAEHKPPDGVGHCAGGEP